MWLVVAGFNSDRVTLLSEKHSAGHKTPSGRAATLAGFGGNARLCAGKVSGRLPRWTAARRGFIACAPFFKKPQKHTQP